MNKILFICGLTATGKTKHAVELAKQFNGELVSADSRQVYKELTILSGKDIPKNVTPQKTTITVQHNQKKYSLVTYNLDGLPIWMYDVISAIESFSVAQFVHVANVVIADIQRRNKLPIIVGGTGLYIRGLTKSMETFAVPPNTKLRKSLNVASIEILQQQLYALDRMKFDSMNLSDQKNPRRLIRAIEVAQWRKKHSDNVLPVDANVDRLTIGLRTSFDLLEQRMQQRVEKRINGAMKEVKELMKRNPPLNLPSRSAIGIKLLEQYLNRKISRQDVINNWTHEELHYAKRQLTWFKKDPSIRWFDVTHINWKKEVVSLVSTWYT